MKIMEFYLIVLMSLQIIHVLTKKYDTSSDESIENLLYFKDCNKDTIAPTTTRPIIRLAGSPKPKAMDCPFPKMCCSLTCGGNECGSSSPFVGRQMEPMQMEQSYSPIEPMGGPPQIEPQVHPQLMRGRKKKSKYPMNIPMQPPIGGRRDFGFTKERIKSLINQDDDIRKILKDLVRVTMKKVNLVDMINARKKALSSPPPETKNRDNDDDNAEDDNDDDDLE